MNWRDDGQQQDAQKARQPAFAEASAGHAKARGSEAAGMSAEALAKAEERR